MVHFPAHFIVVVCVCAPLIVLSGGGGCAVQEKSRLHESTQKNIAITDNQLRLRVRALVDPMCGRIEHQADAIIAGTSDRKVQLAALTWEIDAVPALREALYEPEPIVGAVDALTLCLQMADYFEHGEGKEALGPAASAQAGGTCRDIANDLDRALDAMTKSGDAFQARAFAVKWAADHPIRGSIAQRETVLAHMTEYLSTAGLSPGESIAEVTTTLDDINRKLEVYSSQLFRQARWEAQRMKLELITELHVDEAIPLAERAAKSAEQATGTLDRLAPVIDRSLKVAEDAPALVASERKAAISAVHDELTRTLQTIHDERVAALTDVNTQVAQQRAAALAELDHLMSEQRKQIAVEADHIVVTRIDYAVQQVTRLVAVAMAAGVAMALVGILLFRYLPPRRMQSASRTAPSD